MVNAAAGNVTLIRTPYGGAERLRFQFTADATTWRAVYHIWTPLDVILERFVVLELVGVDIVVRFYDQDGADKFCNLGAAITGGTATEVPIVANLGADRRGRAQTMGAPHELFIGSDTVASRGLLDLYCLDPRASE